MSFDPKEMEVIGRAPSRVYKEGVPIFNAPVSQRQGYFEATYNRNARWFLNGTETSIFCPYIIPDNIARGFVIEANKWDPANYGGPDMFGIEWVFVPVVGGSMEKPGVPHPFDDANDWKDILNFPDPYAWDWDKSGRENKDFLDNGKANMMWFLNGPWFERLISFMGFEDAAVALIDEDQEDALKELFQATTDLYKKIVDLSCETYGDGITGFAVHDDWGSQRAPFFSVDAGREMIVPYMKQLTDHIKSKGKVADLHSCGSLMEQCQNFVAAGWHSWSPMPMNDTKKLQDEYGDKIIIGLIDTPFTEGETPEEMKAQAEEMVKRYYRPDRPAMMSMYSGVNLTEAYSAGLYEASRKMEA